MNPILLIVEREFRTRVRSRGFMIATVLGLIAILALSFAPTLLNALFSGETISVAVVDRTGKFFEQLKGQLTDELPSGKPRYNLMESTESEEQLDSSLASSKLDAYLVIQADAAAAGSGGYSFRLVSSEPAPGAELTRLQGALSNARTFILLQEQGLSSEEVASLFQPVAIQTDVKGSSAETAAAQDERWALTYALVLLLYMTVVLYGTYLSMGVIEEKSTRVVEILISTLRPFQLMMGKVLGIGLVALFQYTIWLVPAFVLLALKGGTESLAVGNLQLEFTSVGPWLLLAFLAFFVLGFFSYAGLFAAGGSLVSRPEDAQQITLPVTIILIAVFFLAIQAMSEPNSTLSTALSIVPLFSPIIMFVRVAMGDPTLWQVAASVILSLVVIVAEIMVAARIFRAGVLLYGRRVRLPEIVKALR